MHPSLLHMLSYPKDEAVVGFYLALLYLSHTTVGKFTSFFGLLENRTLAFIFILQLTSQNCYLCD